MRPAAIAARFPCMNTSPNDTETRRTHDPKANPDAITGAPGSHPLGTGAGAAGGGLAGAAIGTFAGPVGAVAGAVIGAVAGGLAGKALVPELLQSRCTAEIISQAIAPLLADGPERSLQLEGLQSVRAELLPPGAPGAARRAAEEVLSLLEGTP